jgi:hypothetical protein
VNTTNPQRLNPSHESRHQCRPRIHQLIASAKAAARDSQKGVVPSRWIPTASAKGSARPRPVTGPCAQQLFDSPIHVFARVTAFCELQWNIDSARCSNEVKILIYWRARRDCSRPRRPLIPRSRSGPPSLRSGVQLGRRRPSCRTRLVVCRRFQLRPLSNRLQFAVFRPTKNLARPDGFEPPTTWFEGRHSIIRKPMILNLNHYSNRLIFPQDMSP